MTSVTSETRPNVRRNERKRGGLGGGGEDAFGGTTVGPATVEASLSPSPGTAPRNEAGKRLALTGKKKRIRKKRLYQTYIERGQTSKAEHWQWSTGESK